MNHTLMGQIVMSSTEISCEGQQMIDNSWLSLNMVSMKESDLDDQIYDRKRG